MSKKTIIGRETRVDLYEHSIFGVPAKIDTGADSSAIWASDIRIDDDQQLCFKLFDKDSPFYTGEVIKSKNYSVARVKSSLGNETIKFKTMIPIEIKGKKIKAIMGLSDRSTHAYPILIGRRTLSKKFLVDVSMDENINLNRIAIRKTTLNNQLQNNPKEFYETFYQQGA